LALKAETLVERDYADRLTHHWRVGAVDAALIAGHDGGVLRYSGHRDLVYGRYAAIQTEIRETRASLRRSSSSPLMYAVLGGRPSTSRTMLQIATRSRSSLSMVSMSRMRGAYARARPASLHP
jgi:hypothetical protein